MSKFADDCRELFPEHGVYQVLIDPTKFYKDFLQAKINYFEDPVATLTTTPDFDDIIFLLKCAPVYADGPSYKLLIKAILDQKKITLTPEERQQIVYTVLATGLDVFEEPFREQLAKEAGMKEAMLRFMADETGIATQIRLKNALGTVELPNYDSPLARFFAVQRGWNPAIHSAGTWEKAITNIYPSAEYGSNYELIQQLANECALPEIKKIVLINGAKDIPEQAVYTAMVMAIAIDKTKAKDVLKAHIDSLSSSSLLPEMLQRAVQHHNLTMLAAVLELDSIHRPSDAIIKEHVSSLTSAPIDEKKWELIKAFIKSPRNTALAVEDLFKALEYAERSNLEGNKEIINLLRTKLPEIPQTNLNYLLQLAVKNSDAGLVVDILSLKTDNKLTQKQIEICFLEACKTKNPGVIKPFMVMNGDNKPSDGALYTAYKRVAKFASFLSRTQYEAVFLEAIKADDAAVLTKILKDTVTHKPSDKVVKEQFSQLTKEPIEASRWPLIVLFLSSPRKDVLAVGDLMRALDYALNNSSREAETIISILAADNFTRLNQKELKDILKLAIKYDGIQLVEHILSLSSQDKLTNEYINDCFKYAVNNRNQDAIKAFLAMNGDNKPSQLQVSDVFLAAIRATDFATVLAILEIKADNKPSDNALYHAYETVVDKTQFFNLLTNIQREAILSEAVKARNSGVVESILNLDVNQSLSNATIKQAFVRLTESSIPPEVWPLIQIFLQSPRKDVLEIEDLFKVLHTADTDGQTQIRELLFSQLATKLATIQNSNELQFLLELAIKYDKHELVQSIVSLSSEEKLSEGQITALFLDACKAGKAQPVMEFLAVTGENKPSELVITQVFADFIKHGNYSESDWEMMRIFLKSPRSNVLARDDLLNLFCNAAQNGKINDLNTILNLEGFTPSQEEVMRAYHLRYQEIGDRTDAVFVILRAKLDSLNAKKVVIEQNKPQDLATQVYERLKEGKIVPNQLALEKGMKEQIVKLIKNDPDKTRLRLLINDKSSALHQFLSVQRGFFAASEQRGTLAQVKEILREPKESVTSIKNALAGFRGKSQDPDTRKIKPK